MADKVQVIQNRVEAAYYREEEEDSIATMEDGTELALVIESTVASNH